MTSKKKLKRKNEKQQQAFNELWKDYKVLGADTIDLTLLYHDIIKLFVGMDKDLFLRSVRAADRERIDKLQGELKEARKENDAKQRELEERYALGLEYNKIAAGLRAEIEKLKAPKTRMFVGGEEVEVKVEWWGYDGNQGAS